MFTALFHSDYLAIQWGVVLGASLAAGVTDYTARRIPNALTQPLWICGLIWSGMIAGYAGLLEALAASAVLAMPYVLLFVFAGGGAGDAKLMAGIGAWLGMTNGLVVLASVAAAGIFIAVADAVIRKRVKQTVESTAATAVMLVAQMSTRRPAAVEQPSSAGATSEAATKRQIPYGLAILGGVVAAAVGAWLWRA